MSALIKSDAGAGLVQPFALPRPALAAASRHGAVARPVEDPQLAALRQENADLKAAINGLRTSLPQALNGAREEGRCEAIAAFQQDNESRLKELAMGVERAIREWSDSLKQLEDLACILARTALSKLFDESSDHSPFVVGMITRQVDVLRRDTILAIRVSSHDFPDDAALASVAALAGAGSAAIVADPTLPAGECRLDMQLGHVDLGLRSQWGQLSQLLLEMAGEGSLP